MDIKEELKNGKTIYDLPLKVVFYARVSTDNDIQTTSIINQVDYFKNYIKNNPNWTLIEIYIDEGISGKSTKKRDNFLKMIKDAKNKRFHLILTKSVSRFARNTIDSIQYTELLSSYGIGVLFINDNINTFYTDSEFRLTLMASIAQDELRKLSESVKFGLNQSIERGIVLGNNNILGYKKQKGRLIIIEKEAKIVKDIFKLFAKEKYNYLSLSKEINKKYNIKIDSKRIKRILTNYKYKGYYCGRKSQIINYKQNIRKNLPPNEWLIYKNNEKVPPLINEKLWNKVNKLIKEKENIIIPYKNKVFCSIHNNYLKVKQKKYKNKYYYYLICPGCINISSNLLDRIKSYQKIVVYKEKDDTLQLICQKKNNY